MATYDCKALEVRARLYSESVTHRAALVFGEAFGGDWARSAKPGEVFHLAHNWESLPSLTRDQRRACRVVNGLRDRCFAARRVVDRLYYRKMRDGVQITYNNV